MICLTGANKRIRACGHVEGERGTFKLRGQGVRACMQSFRAQRCAAPARSPRHAGLPNSSTAIL
eukprot:659393-Pleurochrysis_carterae.AAC.1